MTGQGEIDVGHPHAAARVPELVAHQQLAGAWLGVEHPTWRRADVRVHPPD